MPSIPEKQALFCASLEGEFDFASSAYDPVPRKQVRRSGAQKACDRAVIKGVAAAAATCPYVATFPFGIERILRRNAASRISFGRAASFVIRRMSCREMAAVVFRFRIKGRWLSSNYPLGYYCATGAPSNALLHCWSMSDRSAAQADNADDTPMAKSTWIAASS